jgi:hypothetical protein
MAKSPAFTPAPRVMFRPGLLLAHLDARTPPDKEISDTARRDLRRYYELVSAILKTITLTREEASACCDAARGRSDLVAAIVDSARTDDPSPAARRLVDAALTWTPVQRAALVDAIERYWLLRGAGDKPGLALAEVGLAEPHSATGERPQPE